MGVYGVLSRRQAFKNSLTVTAASLYYRTEKTKDGRIPGTHTDRSYRIFLPPIQALPFHPPLDEKGRFAARQ